MTDIAIRVENLGKMYRIGAEERRPENLWQAAKQLAVSPFDYLRRITRPPTEEETLWALRNVSFEVKRGEVVGIIGRNGAGKSTLLKILSRITEPTEGRALIHGRVGSLLEVGTGFHPELTGRENIYLNGAILGMRREEIERKFDEIVDFSEVERFIDTPVKRYSSGMYVRLAFAVAAHLEPEILLVDEVLAVGDAAFQKKCLGKMGDVAQEGRTVLFVSHNMGAVQLLCEQTILLEGGILESHGETIASISKYLSFDTSASPERIFKDGSPKDSLSIRAARIKGDDDIVRSNFTSLEPIWIEMEVEVHRWNDRYKVGFDIESEWGAKLFRVFHNDLVTSSEVEIFSGNTYIFRVRIPPHLLNSGCYYVSPCAGEHNIRWFYREDRALKFTVKFQVANSYVLESNRPGFLAPLLDWSVHYCEKDPT